MLTLAPAPVSYSYLRAYTRGPGGGGHTRLKLIMLSPPSYIEPNNFRYFLFRGVCRGGGNTTMLVILESVLIEMNILHNIYP